MFNPVKVLCVSSLVISFSFSSFGFFLSFSGGSGRHRSLSGLLSVNVGAFGLTSIAAIVVPATLSTIVVVSKDQRVQGRRVALCIFDVRNSMELLADCSLHDDILLVLVVLLIRLEVQLIVVGIGNHHFGSLHMHRDGQNALQAEVGVLDVSPVHFFVLVQQVRVLELLDRLFSDLRDPVVHSESAVLDDHLLKVVELIALIIIGFQVLDQLTNVLFFVHDLGRIGQVDSLDHHAGN